MMVMDIIVIYAAVEAFSFASWKPLVGSAASACASCPPPQPSEPKGPNHSSCWFGHCRCGLYSSVLVPGCSSGLCGLAYVASNGVIIPVARRNTGAAVTCVGTTVEIAAAPAAGGRCLKNSGIDRRSQTCFGKCNNVQEINQGELTGSMITRYLEQSSYLWCSRGRPRTQHPRVLIRETGSTE